MFTYLTSGQIIIGLKSLHPIKRMIKEKHFKKALLVFSNDRNSMYHLGDLRRYLKHIKVPYEIIAADLRRDSIDVTDDIDLIISIGVRHVHDIAKISNRNHVALYCIESIPGHMSSYGTGCIWVKKNPKIMNVMPDIIFNSCRNVARWNIHDIVYFLHAIPLAIDACFSKGANDFVVASGIGGVIEFLRIHEQISKTNSPWKLRQLYKELCYADILMKNADNNLPLTDESERIAKATEHYRQFEIAVASESHDVIDNHVKRDSKKFDAMLKKVGSNLIVFEKQFQKFYNEYINHPEQWSFAGDVLGKKIEDIMGVNTKTRRIE